MTESILESNSPATNGKVRRLSIKNFSFFGLFTCLATLVLAFLFKDYVIYLLSYLDLKSRENIVEFHLILVVLFICVSLPMLWGYIICVLICSYVYSFMYGFMLVSCYSAIGMSSSFVICRYMFYEFAHQRVKNVAYLSAISNLIESREKGFQIIFLSRLMPIPFGLANSLFAVTDVQFTKYMVASVIGLIPTQLILCYMGSTLKSMSDVLDNEHTAKTASLVFIVQLFIAFGVMYYILHAAKNELNKHIEEDKKCKLSCEDLLIVKCSYCKNEVLNGQDSSCEHCGLIGVSVQKD